MTKNEKKVSVIVPVYNGEEFLEGAIQNILQQAYYPLEIIVVDDGSTDGTAAIVSECQATIAYLHQSNRGHSSARNYGIRSATGEVIAFLDVDDRWTQGNLLRLVSCLNENPSVDIAQGLIQEMHAVGRSSDGKLIFQKKFSPYKFINIGSAIYRKTVFEKVGGFDESLRYSEDIDWFFRAWEMRISKKTIIEIALYYFIHPQNMTKEYHARTYGYTRIIKKHLNHSREQKSTGTNQPSIINELNDYLGMDDIKRSYAQK